MDINTGLYINATKTSEVRKTLTLNPIGHTIHKYRLLITVNCTTVALKTTPCTCTMINNNSCILSDCIHCLL